MTRTPRSRFPFLESLESRVLLSVTPQVVGTLPGSDSSSMVVDRQGDLFVAVDNQLFELSPNQTTLRLAADFSSLSNDKSSLPPTLSLSVDNAGNVYAYQDNFRATTPAGQLFELPAGASTPRVAFTFTSQTTIPGQVAVDDAGNIFTILNRGNDNIPTMVKIRPGSSKITPIARISSGYLKLPSFDQHDNAFGLSSTGIYEIPAGSHRLKTLTTFDDNFLSNTYLYTVNIDAAGNFFASASVRDGSAPFIELPVHQHTILALPSSADGGTDFVVDANDNLIGLAANTTVFEFPSSSSTPLQLTADDSLPFENYSLALAAPDTLYLLANPFFARAANVMVPSGPAPDPGPPFTTAITLYKVALLPSTSPTPTPTPTHSLIRAQSHHTSPH